MQFDQERLVNYAKLIGQDLVTNLLAVLWTPIGQERHAQILGAIGLIFLFLRAVSQATGSEQYLNLMFQIFTKLPNANDAAVIVSAERVISRLFLTRSRPCETCSTSPSQTS